MDIEISKQIRVGPGHPLLVLAGPCQIESYDHCMRVGEELKKICEELAFPLVFKSSYDKANRTSLDGVRGVGIDEGLKILARIRSDLGVPVVTDVHSPDEAQMAGEIVDIIQTPAFLCRQTDLLIASGETGRVVHIKKGQFLAPDDMKYAADKVASTGNNRIMLCERGTCFGYHDLVVDMRSLIRMRSLGYPVIFDATHSVQAPGGAKGSSGGDRSFIEPLALAATAMGIDGLFLECHENPAKAPSDGASMLPLKEVARLLKRVAVVRNSLEAESKTGPA